MEIKLKKNTIHTQMLSTALIIQLVVIVVVAAAAAAGDSSDSAKQSTVTHPSAVQVSSSLGQLYREARDGSSRRTDRCFNCHQSSMTDRARFVGFILDFIRNLIAGVRGN